MNWFRNAHWGVQNKYKQELAFHLKSQLEDCKPIKGNFEVKYMYYYKNPASDLTNVCSLASKVFLDALQELDLVADDSVKHCKAELFYVGDKSLNDPRVEIEVTAQIF